MGRCLGCIEKAWWRNKYLIFRALHKYMGTILENKNNKFVCEMDNKKNYALYNEIGRNFYIKVLERKKIVEQLNRKYDDKIGIKFIVYR